MKKIFGLSAVLLSVSFLAAAQKTRDLKPVMELKITDEGGANAASVAWHPILKRYYAAMAGNAEHPLTIFDANGKQLSKPGMTTMVDVRGLWYNPKVRTFQTNAYGDGGLVQYKLDEKGKPISFVQMPVEMTKPGDQSVGAFDPVAQMVYFYFEGLVEGHSIVDGTISKTTELHLTYASKQDEEDGLYSNEDFVDLYNPTAIIYTGIAGAEWGIINFGDLKVELYNKATGYLTQILKLPEDMPVVEENFNFSFANGIVWIFNKEGRTWVGYK